MDLYVEYLIAALIHCIMIAFSRLESRRPSIHTLGSPSLSSNYNHLLYTSRQTPPKQLATLLTALGAFADKRTYLVQTCSHSITSVAITPPNGKASAASWALSTCFVATSARQSTSIPHYPMQQRRSEPCSRRKCYDHCLQASYPVNTQPPTSEPPKMNTSQSPAQANTTLQTVAPGILPGALACVLFQLVGPMRNLVPGRRYGGDWHATGYMARKGLFSGDHARIVGASLVKI